MNDTGKHTENIIKETIMNLSGEERLILAAKSHEAARSLVIASLKANLTVSQINKELFLRFYKNDFNEEDLRMIIEQLKMSDE